MSLIDSMVVPEAACRQGPWPSVLRAPCVNHRLLGGRPAAGCGRQATFGRG
jgi:hypothetical protein